MQRSFGEAPEPRFKKKPLNKRFTKNAPVALAADDHTHLDQRFEDIKIVDELDAKLGFERYDEGPERLGWLLNMQATLVKDYEWPGGRAAVDYYFVNELGDTFKTTLLYEPYFYIAVKPGREGEVEEYLRRKFERVILSTKRVRKEDLKLPNHLLGYTRTFLQLSFRNVSDLLQVRKVLMPIVKKNQAKQTIADTYAEVINGTNQMEIGYDEPVNYKSNASAGWEHIIDIREYDVPYYLRVAIDKNIRVGLWYTVRASSGFITLTHRADLVKRAEPVVLAFDIETTKLPLKFPDSSIDSIMMISYMVDGRGYLITNREIVSQDIADFEYTPKPEYEGPFEIFNEPDEEAVLRKFFEHIQLVRPLIFVTYNGDSFDWPFVEARAKVHGIDMYQEIGFYKNDQDEYQSHHASHMDAFRWVKRDSYLPQGSQGLKAVTTAKLGYNPMELDPEEMTPYAAEQPQVLAQYSVSDAVATYYLYMKYVHPFTFSLCNIIPLIPDDVLRKGSGTLCEILLMVQAYEGNIIMPNKHTDEHEKMFEGHLIESETYVGGHVEALEAGVFRSDIPAKFKIVPEAVEQLMSEVDDALRFTIQVEHKAKLSDVQNYEEVKQSIMQSLQELRDNPMRNECPKIYHLDVAAMYPNIILTNRLQPDALIDESVCATCDYNRPGKNCDRRMTWSWRGEYFPAKRSEYNMIKNQLSLETFPPKRAGDEPRNWSSLSEHEQTTLLRKRLTEYSRKVYKKTHHTKIIERESIVCQRENPFYVETVKAFRDRRYEYKGLHKKWKRNLDERMSEGALAEVDEAKKMIVLYDSLQLAHKCILNSFYGYVMRKGARWFSMEMAGIVCLTGARIIQMARQLVEQIGRPLELDTDGIWCILPSSFPENYTLKLSNGKSLPVSYPCTMLNHLVHAKFTNEQYQTFNSVTQDYDVHSENSIFFEVDGPYRAMILPSSKEEDKLLKKRYAVFNDDGSLAELKGFEVKRRGELKLIKIFQSQIFKVFLEGKTLEECYAAVAKVSNQWLDVLYSKAVNLSDEELVDLISENRSMSRTLEDYGGQKSTSISTAKRLAEFLGDQMVKDKGLACKFIISAKPAGAPVTERAVPVAIFSAELSVKKHFLRKWLKDNSLTTFDMRDLLDWPYYLDRFGSVIQKLITIPAAMQKVPNPVPRVRHPDWLFKRVASKDDKFKQHRITDIFSTAPRREQTDPTDMSTDENESDVENRPPRDQHSAMDIEDFGQGAGKLPLQDATLHRLNAREGPAVESATDDGPQKPIPSIHEDYSGWVAGQKRKWRKIRQDREREQALFGGVSDRAFHDNTLGSFLRRQASSLIESSWQIIQIGETNTPGEFTLWCLIDRSLHSIRLTVPRILYVNSREDATTDGLQRNSLCRVERRVRTLPRSHQTLNLFEMVMPESVYQAEQKKFNSFFNHPATEGVYETQVPLLMRALLNLGALCRVDVGARQRSGRSLSDERFHLEDLRSVDIGKGSYLAQPDVTNYIYLSHNYSDRRHFFGMTCTATGKCFIAVVGAAKDMVRMPDLEDLYTQKYAQKRREAQSKGQNLMNSFIQYSEMLSFEVTYQKSEKDALQYLQKQLEAYKEARRGPTILILHSQRSFNILSQQLHSLNDFPCTTFPSHHIDNHIPAMDWLRPLAQRLVSRYLQLGAWIAGKVQLARYANLPFCNIPNDPYILLADVFFARRLIKHDMVLWWSSSARPDLGGREQDDNMYVLDELVNPEINNQGSYEHVCLEVDVLRLCVNTILQAALVNELEGASAAVGFNTTAHNLDDYSSSVLRNNIGFGEGQITTKTFGILRSMIQGWFAEALSGQNAFAENMVMSAHRWLTSSSSNMYDPCMYGLVHGMMKKVFMQLIAELRVLGCKIVHANFNKIIVVTSKDTIDSALAYGSYVLKAVMDKDIFAILELRPMQYFDRLIWMDTANYGGVVSQNHALQDGTHVDDERDVSESVEMNWNIRDYLPVALHHHFDDVIREFIKETHQQHASLSLSRRKQVKLKNTDLSTFETMADQGEAQFAKTYVSHHVARKLLELTDMINRLRIEAQKDEALQKRLAFPQLAGSHLHFDNPALEFIKSVCHVLALDKHIEHEVRVIKRNALTSIGIREFSPQAQFRNPCESVKLPQVICAFCDFTTDLDFCRDRNLLDSDGEGRRWQCQGCQTAYDNNYIEEHLVDQVQRHAMAYNLQDLKCTKCRQIKTDNLSRICHCSGQYMPTINKDQFLTTIRVFGNIAERQNLRFLKEVVQWTMSHASQ